MNDNTPMQIRCLIIEDEHHATEHLEYRLFQSGYPVKIIGKLKDVEAAVEWLKTNTADLIFLDVQLGNEMCFEIFDHVKIKTPVVFTTSFNQYAIDAFTVNSIAYLLKPIDLESLQVALEKYQFIYEGKEGNAAVNEKLALINPTFQKRFLVQTGNTIKSIPVEEVVLVKVQKKYLLITTKDKSQYLLEGALDVLEQRLDPEKFFRINRQFIVNIDTIHTMHPFTRGRLQIETIPQFKEELIVATEKTPGFKSWLNR